MELKLPFLILLLSNSFEQIKRQIPQASAIIFIHGTIGAREILLKGQKNLAKEELIQTQIHNRKSFNNYKNHICLDLGLQEVKNLNKEGNLSSGKAAYPLINLFLKLGSPISNYDHTYTFGWLGSLDLEERYKSGANLFSQIIKLKKQFFLENKNLKVDLVGLSHGVNVILSAMKFCRFLQSYSSIWPSIFFNDQHYAKLIKKQFSHQQLLMLKKEISLFELNDVIAIAGPVQKETENEMFNNFTKYYFHLFSNGDHVQNADTKTTNHSTCSRTLSIPKNHKQTSKVMQAQIKLKEKGATYNPTHSDMLASHNVKQLAANSKYSLLPIRLLLNLATQFKSLKIHEVFRKKYFPHKTEEQVINALELIKKILAIATNTKGHVAKMQIS